MVYVIPYDIILIGEMHDGVNARQEVRKKALKFKGSRLSITRQST